jgi:hypothetical protein
MRPRRVARLEYLRRPRFDAPVSLATVPTPIFLPLCSPPTAYHVARHIARLRRLAKCRSSASACTAIRYTGHSRSFDEDMPFTGYADSATDETYQRIACIYRICVRAGMARATSPVNFTSCNARQPNMRSFGAPDRPVTIPNSYRRTLKRLPGGNDGGGKE